MPDKIGPGPTGRTATRESDGELAGLWWVTEADGRPVTAGCDEAGARLLVGGMAAGKLLPRLPPQFGP